MLVNACNGPKSSIWRQSIVPIVINTTKQTKEAIQKKFDGFLTTRLLIFKLDVYLLIILPYAFYNRIKINFCFFSSKIIYIVLSIK